MSAMPVKMTVRWVVPLGASRSITETLHRVMMAARASRGCVGCSVATDVGRQVGVRYMEEWEDEEQLRRELRSDRFGTLATLMEFGVEPPIVEFVLPDGIRGLDYVQEVRAAEPN